MMVLAAKENLCSAQCNITAAFLHAKLPNNEHFYMHQPRDFKDNNDYILCLKRSLYRLKQSPGYFVWYLSKHLERQGLVPSLHDLCLFLSKDIIVIVYVDGMLVHGRDKASINHFVDRMMKEEEVKLRREGTAEG